MGAARRDPRRGARPVSGASRRSAAALAPGRSVEQEQASKFQKQGRLCAIRAAPWLKENLMLAPVRRFFPEPRQRLTAAGTAHGSCTPPRISPSCPHYVPLWLGRSTIVRGQDHCEAACQSCFWMDGYRSSPYWAVFMQKQCFPHRWSSRILRIAVPFLAHPLDVIQSLDMYFSSCTRGLKKDPLMW